MTKKTKIIVLDDDPTGSQTVHGCLLLMQWDVAVLTEALTDSAPLFFILTNTRGVDAAHAAAITREVCHNLKTALAAQDVHAIFVSRSDSTLRGHYPIETDVIAKELGPFDAHFLVPAFFEGGRFTRASVHYLISDGREIPVHETEFARDSVFAYRHSYLPDYVEEKTHGRLKAGDVVRWLLEDLRHGVYDRLLALHDNACVVVDAEKQDDLDRFAADLLKAAAQGKRFLFRSAASLITSLARLPPQPVAAASMAQYVRGHAAGAVIVGSHVPRTTRQLEELLKLPGVVPIEVDVNRLTDESATLLKQVLAEAESVHREKHMPVIFTSRAERRFPDGNSRLVFGKQVSAFLMEVVRGLPPTLGFLVSKGGITSNDVLSTGLQLRTARLLGQILPGVSVVRCPHEHPRYPGLPVVIFPGNVGDERALATVVERLYPAAAKSGGATG
ncbi:MAG: four-carbon acid sugar kinase family protein [Sulfuricaulis sp.]